MKILFCLFSLFFSNSGSFGNYQAKDTFFFSGKINGIDSGRIELVKICGDEFYDAEILHPITTISNGKFLFKGRLNYPHGFYAVITSGKNSIHTEMFFLSKGKQFLYVDRDSLKNDYLPIQGSLTNKEYIEKFQPDFIHVNRLYKRYIELAKKASVEYGKQIPKEQKEIIHIALKEYIDALDDVIKSFIHKYPYSYVGLWRLLERFSVSGYKKTYDTTFFILKNRIQETKTGLALKEGLTASRVTAVGMSFPEIRLIDSESREVTVAYTKQYTLIDFWYSNCTPCIASFPDHISVYKKYRDAGFEIIGISIDKKERRDQWISAISTYQLPWKQLWDYNGLFAERLFIHSYPTSFLVDSNGTILKKNITSYQLEEFLKNNLLNK